MHAILGFSASELMRNDPSILPSAMNHRIKAIRAIKKRLAETTKSSMNYEEANAMVATCFALTFQSVSLDDGLAEYLTFIRGIMIVGMQMMFRGIKPMFDNMFEQEQDALLEPLMQGLPLIPKGFTDSAIEALTNLRPLCAEEVELEYHQHLMTMVEKLYVNSWDGESLSAKHKRHPTDSVSQHTKHTHHNTDGGCSSHTTHSKHLLIRITKSCCSSTHTGLLSMKS
jgi:hypothetical protein